MGRVVGEYSILEMGTRVETRGDLIRFLRSGNHTRNLTVAVVGNGPISFWDRDEIEDSHVVVRFNDCNFLKPNERTTLRVVRHPSARAPSVPVHAPVWHIAYNSRFVHNDAAVFTPVYEAQYGGDNELPSSARIFPSCHCGDSCLQRGRFAGPSTGAVALSQLQQLDEVSKIKVFGMNWNGDANVHIDFANRSLVSGCCTKCEFHTTSSNLYGTEIAGATLGVFSIGGVIFFALSGLEARHLLAPRKEAERPLLGLKHPA